MPQLPPYRLIRSRRKTIGIQLTPDNQVVVRCPHGLPIAQIEAILAEKAAWLEKHRNRLAAIPKEPPFSPAELQQMAQRTEALLKERLPPPSAASAPAGAVAPAGAISISTACWRWSRRKFWTMW